MTGPPTAPPAQPATPFLPSGALIWLIASFGLLLLPQLSRLPVWLSGACVLLAGWRWLVQGGYVRLPGRLVKIAVMLALVSAYVATVNAQFSVETASSFFVLAVGLKWLETRTTRDFYVLFFILCYLAAVNFLFEQGIPWTLVNLAAVFIILVGLQVLNAPDAPNAMGAGGRRLGKLLLKTLPIVVLLFIFFPRLSPLWSVPLVSGQARTGLSDTMTPGDISSLAQSSERAFRVTFGGATPPRRERYWRGLILDRFNGERWDQGASARPKDIGRVLVDGGVGQLQPGQYDVLLEPTDQRWAFALDNSRAVSSNVRRTSNGLFEFRRPADTTVRYRMAMEPEAGKEPQTLTQAEQRRYLQLPASGNPRARELASQLASISSGADDFVRRVLSRFRNQPYFYTLRPPKMPEDSVDALLFDAKRGFCAHYASATAFLLRAVGIPARIVAGYQGGSAGADSNYLIIRQYDAHAWVEAWMPDRGWVRVDPTAAISPERIEQGLEQAVADEGSFLENEWASAEKYGDMAAVQWLSLQLDAINYQWQRWVVGYQGQTQLNLMSRLPGNWSLAKLGYVTAGLLATLMLLAAAWTAWRSYGAAWRDPSRRLLMAWHKVLEKQGVKVDQAETPSALADRADQQGAPDAPLHRAFAQALNNHYYSESNHLSESDRQRLRRLLKRMAQRSASGPRRVDKHFT
jgi:transglutaminase-like putative cysteine protease